MDLPNALNGVSSAKEGIHQDIIDASMDGFVLAEMDGRILKVNDAYSRMSGYSIRELLLMNLADLEERGTSGIMTAHRSQLMSLGRECFESRHRRKDGSIMDVKVSLLYSTLDQTLASFIRDISEQNAKDQIIR